ncbi:MAG: glutamine--fructose-6-phosphate aminotransferase [isomerizing] [Lysobacteraceae bacterium]|nr:MAG: glutamine--fructose-6-phosphate aminotransferase [isomerizing] [Xanthomonadaceae bacterium]
MCGIVAATAERDVVPILLAGLQALEYRGYDSAGFCVHVAGHLARLRTEGKVQRLKELQEKEALAGPCGIAHTRWATHGPPTTRNAHPHTSGDSVSVVHNGIIENHAELRAELIADGFEMATDTDTEVIAHLIARAEKQGMELFAAVRDTVSRLKGAYAIAVASRSQPQMVCGARKGSPLVVGLGIGENFLASDIHALLPVTNRFIYLEEGDAVAVTRQGVVIVDRDGKQVKRRSHESEFTADTVDRGQYRHYMLKEIHEQPAVVAETLEGRLMQSSVPAEVFGPLAADYFGQVEHVQIIACGTSYHAGLVARHWLESLAKISCSVEVASEYRYRNPVVVPNSLFLTISQSGETADTLSALRMAKERDYLTTVTICNVPESSLVRESDHCLMTRAGPEIGVASTKAFTTQLTALALLVIQLAEKRGADEAHLARWVEQLHSLPGRIREVLRSEKHIARLAQRFGDKHHALFLGRGSHYPIAMEGALKLKEISYIHAEAYPAGELKHGPLALVDEQMPVIAVAPNDELLGKLTSNLEEVRARGGELFVVADKDAAAGMHDDSHLILLDPVPDLIAPIIHTIPLQLLAYHVAVLKGTDVDQPRNLAKSVTVE